MDHIILEGIANDYPERVKLIISLLEEKHWDAFRKNNPERNRAEVCLFTNRYQNGYVIEQITYRDLHRVLLGFIEFYPVLPQNGKAAG